MKTIRLFVAAAITAALISSSAQTQPPTPGPEHAQLKKMEGTWDTTMKMMGQESKGTSTYKMDLGGLWLASTFETDMGGQKFSGRGFDSYDAGKKKFVGVWVDSMTTQPMVTEGTYDKEKKVMTMIGDAPGPDGKPMKHRMTTEMKDDNTMLFTMFMGDAKEPTFTILYKRKK